METLFRVSCPGVLGTPSQLCCAGKKARGRLVLELAPAHPFRNPPATPVMAKRCLSRNPFPEHNPAPRRRTGAEYPTLPYKPKPQR